MNQNAQLLTQLLTQEINLANQLLDLMLDEKNALEENAVDKLNEISATKAGCLDQIESISRKRIQLLLACSTKPTTIERMQHFISEQPENPQKALNQLVAQLDTTLAKCRNQNSVNGMVISMGQRNIQRNLNIIKGSDTESMTYTDKGQTTSFGQSKGGLKV